MPTAGGSKRTQRNVQPFTPYPRTVGVSGDCAWSVGSERAVASVAKAGVSDEVPTTLDLGGHTLTVTDGVDAPSGAVSGGTVVMSGDGSLEGTVDDLNVGGAVSLQGSTVATGPVAIRGSRTADARNGLRRACPRRRRR